MSRVLVLIVAVSLLAGLQVGCSRGGSYEAAATAAADATAAPTLSITAKDLKFDKKALVMPPNQSVIIELRNEDGGALHNVAIYTDGSAKNVIFRGELFGGVRTVSYRFTTPAAGVYYFRCDAHPDMNGAFIAK